jgi:hypothetical protein
VSDDWLEVEPTTVLTQVSLPKALDVPLDYVERTALMQSCWSKLSDKQRLFLTAWRESRYNAVMASRALGGSPGRKAHNRWMDEPEYATVVRIWRGIAADSAMDRDRLLARQDDIVETLLTPKPILHQGSPTGFEEVNAAGASRANETLMKAAGLLKEKELDINLGIVGPAFTIQVVQPNGSVIDATPRGVTIDLPPPEDEEWL